MRKARQHIERARRHGTAATDRPHLDDLIPRDVISFVRRYLPFELSPAWQTFIEAMYGVEITDVAVLRELCGFDEPATGGYGTGEVVAGRRSGKSAVAAVLALYEAIVVGPDHMRWLAPGQRGYIVIVSRTQRQALEFFRYARAVVERNPELCALLDGEPLESVAGGELRFRGFVALSVFPASKGSTRGFTILAAFFDEWAFIASDEQSADQDAAILSAIEFGTLAPEGAPRRRILIISSPAGRTGVVFTMHAQNYGRADAPVLVAQSPTWAWNPSISREQLEAQRRRDPRAFAREVEAQFQDSVSAWCDSTVLIASTNGRDAAPLPPGPWVYAAAVDLAFKRDNCVLAIGHAEHLPAELRGPAPVVGTWDATLQREVVHVQATVAAARRFVVDGVWKWTPRPGRPLDAVAVVAAMGSFCRAYRVGRVAGDQFCAVPMASEFQRQGLRLVEIVMTNRSKLDVFTPLREAFYLGAVSLPADEQVLRELIELEERITPGGYVQVAAPDRAAAHDDAACAIALLHSEVREQAREIPEAEYGRFDRRTGRITVTR